MTPRWKIRRKEMVDRGVPYLGVWLVYRPNEDTPCASYFLWENAITHVDIWFSDRHLRGAR